MEYLILSSRLRIKRPLEGVNHEKVAGSIPSGGVIGPRYAETKKKVAGSIPYGGVIRPRYWNTMVFNHKNQWIFTPLLRETQHDATCNWRNLRGTRGTVHFSSDARRSN